MNLAVKPLPKACPEGHYSSQYTLVYWVKSLPTDVTLAAQKPLVLPVTDRARLKKLPHTMARNVLPITHLMTCGMENLQPFQHLHKRLSSRSVLSALCCDLYCDGSKLSNGSQKARPLSSRVTQIPACYKCKQYSKGISSFVGTCCGGVMLLVHTDSQVLEKWYTVSIVSRPNLSNTKSLVFRQQQALLTSMPNHKHQQQHMWPTSHTLVSLHSALRLVNS